MGKFIIIQLKTDGKITSSHTERNEETTVLHTSNSVFMITTKANKQKSIKKLKNALLKKLQKKMDAIEESMRLIDPNYRPTNKVVVYQTTLRDNY